MFTIESTQHIELVVLTVVNNTYRIRKVFYDFLIIFLGFGTTGQLQLCQVTKCILSLHPHNWVSLKTDVANLQSNEVEAFSP